MNNSMKNDIKDSLKQAIMDMMAAQNFNPNAMKPTGSAQDFSQEPANNSVEPETDTSTYNSNNNSEFKYGDNFFTDDDSQNTTYQSNSQDATTYQNNTYNGGGYSNDTYEDAEDVDFSSDTGSEEFTFTPIPSPTPTNTERVAEPVQSATESNAPDEDKFSQTMMEMENRMLRQKLAEMQNQVKTLTEFMNSPEQAQTRERVNDNVFNNTQPFEQVISEPYTSTFAGQPFKYRRFSEEVHFGRRFERSLNDEDTAKSYTSLMAEVMADIEKNYGGWDRVTDLAVVHGVIVINSVSYEPQLPDSYISALPFDVRRAVADGRMAWLFDFGVLKNMRNLANLKFDSTSFVYNKVRKDLRVMSEFKPSTFFKVCKKLLVLDIKGEVLYAKDPTRRDDMFKRASRCEEIYQSCVAFGWGQTKARWNSIKDVYQDPDRSGLSKAWGITWNAVGAGVAGVGTLGVKAVGLAGKIGKGIKNFTTSLKDNMN